MYIHYASLKLQRQCKKTYKENFSEICILYAFFFFFLQNLNMLNIHKIYDNTWTSNFQKIQISEDLRNKFNL